MKTPDSVSEYRQSIDTLDRAIVGLTARINATTYELLVLVREFDERGGWLRHNFSNCAEWLAYRCDLSSGAAREKVRVAHALKGLPAIAEGFETGALSYSKVRALTRVANQANEAALLEFARSTTVTRVEERCRQLRNVQPDSVDVSNRAHGRRSLTMRRNAETGMLTITVEVPIEDGELIDKALTKAMEKYASASPEFASESFRAQQADALVSIARDTLAENAGGRTSSADAYQVIVHVDQSALTQGEGRSDLPVETVKRLTCDGSVVPLFENAQGEPLSVGRKQRTVTTAIRRALESRDGGCTFPGCNHKRFVDAHHVMHWAEGGSTSVDNLLLLCDRHHRLVHEGRFMIRKDVNDRWYFCRPDGRAIPGCGYHLDDMLDEDIGSISAEQAARKAAEKWLAQGLAVTQQSCAPELGRSQ